MVTSLEFVFITASKQNERQ